MFASIVILSTDKEVKVPKEVTLPCAAVDKVPVRFVADTVVNPDTVEGSPTVTVPLDSATSTSFDVPENVIVPPKAVAVEFDPSETVIELLDNFEFAIDPAS